MIQHALLFLLLVALIGFWRFGPRLTIPVPAINWRRVGIWSASIVAVAAIVAAAYYFGLWAFIVSTVSGWSFNLPWADILAVAVVLILFALLARLAWKRPWTAGAGTAGVRPPLFPRWFKQTLLVAALVAAVVAVFILAPQEHPYHPANWTEGLRGWVSSWTLQTKQAVLVATIAAIIGAWFWKGRLAALGVAAAALAAAIFLAPPGMLDDNRPDGTMPFSVGITNPLPRTCDSVTRLVTIKNGVELATPKNCLMAYKILQGTIRMEDAHGRAIEIASSDTRTVFPAKFEAVLIGSATSQTKAELTFRSRT